MAELDIQIDKQEIQQRDNDLDGTRTYVIFIFYYFCCQTVQDNLSCLL
jgi:hypothetical protein